MASRLLVMIVGFAVLAPIGFVVRTNQSNVVRSGGLPGAALGAEPLIAASTATTAPPDVPAAPAAATPAPPPTAPGAAAPSTAAPQTEPPQTAAASVAPATTAKKKTTTTTAQPAPVTTAAAPRLTNPPTTKAPTTTEPPATSPPTSPPTTAAATAPPANSYSKAEVETIIRSVFPADQADEAVRIATRESNLVPTVRNWCCFGLFQIYFEVNQATLAAIGITSAEQLYDPVVNTQAAYVMYQRSGWAPWR